MPTGRQRFDAAIFDMDGLLLESESLWRQAEQEASDDLGLGLDEADFIATMGVRMHDVARIWFERKPWTGPSPTEVAERVIDRVIELVADVGPLPGVEATIDRLVASGLRVGLCSSSPLRLIDAAVKATGLEGRFEVLHSAEHDEYGKPHPMPYLVTAGELGVDASRCLAFEDSITGCVSARAAGMTVVAVPDGAARGSGRFAFADVVLESLEHFDDAVLGALDDRVPAPSISRPRFHLAFAVDDLAAARTFYGDVLGCPEGRSSDTWVDFDLYGHQIVAHLDGTERSAVATNEVDGHQVPANHFGLVLPVGPWRDLAERLRGAGVEFVMEPTTRFEGSAGEQHTFFVRDPAGNALEFKALRDDRRVFAND